MRKLRLAAASWALSISAPIATAAALASCNGGGAEGGCPATESCGDGNPTGFWRVNGTCQFSPTQPSQPLNYSQYMKKPQDPVVAPVQPLATTGGDWCAALFYPAPGAADGGASGVQNVNLWHSAATLQSGTVALNPDKTYQTNLVFQAPSVTHFTQACLQMSGFSPTCAELQTDLVRFYASTKGQKFVNPNGTDGKPIPGPPVQCASGSDNSCDCSSTFEVDLLDQGTWTASGGVLVQNSEVYTYNGLGVPELQPTVSTSAAYCLRNGLTLTGSGGTSLAGVLGLRTLILVPAQPPAATGGDGGP